MFCRHFDKGKIFKQIIFLFLVRRIHSQKGALFDRIGLKRAKTLLSLVFLSAIQLYKNYSIFYRALFLLMSANAHLCFPAIFTMGNNCGFSFAFLKKAALLNRLQSTIFGMN